MRAFNVGVIGCGRIAQIYKKIFLKYPDIFNLVCVVDKDITRAESFASSFPSCTAFETIDGLIELKPEVVHVLTPHFLHSEHIIKCLENGINVLSEKPIGINMDQARDIVNAAKVSKAKVGIIFQNRYIEGVQKVRRLIQDGSFGKIKGAWSHLAWFRPESYYACDWKGSWNKEGGGVVIDQAIHSIDLVRYMLGSEAVGIQGHYARRVLTTIEVEDEADAAIRFDNGIIYAFSACNYYSSNSPIEIEISSDMGSAYLRGATMTITLDGKTEVIKPSLGDNNENHSYWGNYHEKQLLDYYSKLDNGEDLPFSVEDAAKTLAIVLGIYSSSRSGGVEVIPESL